MASLSVDPTLLGYLIFLSIALGLAGPVGRYMAKVFTGEITFLAAFERAIYRIAGVNAAEEQRWTDYAKSFLTLSFVGTVALYGLLRVQSLLPTFDSHIITTPMTPDLAANTAVSFATTTTWQAYAGEPTMSALLQMVGLCAQNFLAGAAGLAVGIAFIRGLAQSEKDTLGNFWVDLTRGMIYILIPLSIVGSVCYVASGVPMNWLAGVHATTIEGSSQFISQGPVAALEMIKNLGTNGGGFFNANAAHPYETPNNIANLLSMLAIIVLPAALTQTFGHMTGQRKQGWVLLGAMTFLFVGGLILTHAFESHLNPAQVALHVHGPNLEGKETRFGLSGSVLAAAVTSNAATGSYNSMHDSYSPLGGAIPLLNMLMGEIVYGGLGTGLFSMILVAILGIFLCGLMVGRTPEYLGKRIRSQEMVLVMLSTLIGPMVVLGLTAIAVGCPAGLAGLTTNQGPHGLTEILYGYSSAFANNGQSFAGLSVNSPFYNITTLVAMFAGRFGLICPALALAGSFSRQRTLAGHRGAVQTDNFTFGVIIVATAVLVTALAFLPALTLGPGIEQLRMTR